MKAKRLLTPRRGLKAAARPLRVVRGLVGVTPLTRRRHNARTEAFAKRVNESRLGYSTLVNELRTEIAKERERSPETFKKLSADAFKEILLKRLEERAKRLPARMQQKMVLRAGLLALDAVGIFRAGKRRAILRIFREYSKVLGASDTLPARIYNQQLNNAVGGKLRGTVLRYFFLRNMGKLLR